MAMLLSSSSGPEMAQHVCTVDSMTPKAQHATRSSGTDAQQGLVDASSACALWCTIAIGGLVLGQPPEEVRKRGSLLQAELDWGLTCCRSAYGGYHERRDRGNPMLEAIGDLSKCCVAIVSQREKHDKEVWLFSFAVPSARSDSFREV